MNRGQTVKENMGRKDVRDRHHFRMLQINLERVSPPSGKVRWYCQASRRLECNNAIVYVSMSFGSVKRGSAARMYRRISGFGLLVIEMASRILDVKSRIKRASDKSETARCVCVSKLGGEERSRGILR